MEMAQDELVLMTIDESVAVLTLNRPDRGNGWTGAMGRRYFRLLEQAAHDPAVRAIVVTGAGKSFCVGGDGANLANAADAGAVAITTNYPFWFPLRVGKPVIAAINGACFGIGLQQILCCDVRIAADDAKFATAYARRGLVAEYGMSWLLPRIVGTGHAMDLLLSGRLVRAVEAEKMGLVNSVVPAAELIVQATDYAKQLATLCAPSSMAMIKRQAFLDITGTLPEAVSRAETLLSEALAGEEFKEGVKSWLEQRSPAFPPLADNRALLDLG